VQCWFNTVVLSVLLPHKVSLFEAIQYVGTPIALVAFIVAVVAYAYRGRLEARRKLIEAAPEQERARLLEATLRDFSTVPTDTLTREQRYDLAVRLIAERTAKFKMMTMVSVVIAGMLAAVVVIFTLFPAEAEGGSLTVRVQGPNGPDDFITTGSVTLDAGSSRTTRALGPDGQVRFENIPDRAFKGGVEVIPNISGYHAVSNVKLTDVPENRVYRVTVAPDPTRVYGTVVDGGRKPLDNVVLDFQAGVAVDTTDERGNFSVTLPYPPGTQVPVRGSKSGSVGLNDRITIPDAAAITLHFTPRS
jgi:hypothetical protein